MLSDSAIREAGTNKLSLIGTFSGWTVQSLPFRTPPFVITPFITNFRHPGKHTFTVAVEHVQTRQTVLSAGGEAMIGVMPGAPVNPARIPASAVIDAPLPIPMGVTFVLPGMYKIVVYLDGEEIGNREFEVTPQQPPSVITPETPS